jgi:hypothetical protein
VNTVSDDRDVPTGDPVTFSAPLRRPAPPEVADEREALEGWLDHFRGMVLDALVGLDDAALRRRVPDAGLNLLGVVKHLTELERTWLVERWGQRGGRTAWSPSYVDDPDAGFRLADVEQVEPLVAAYQAVCEQGRDALAGAESLDDAVRDDRRGHIELRWILLHLITETARWAGAAQTIRTVLVSPGVSGPPEVPAPPDVPGPPRTASED